MQKSSAIFCRGRDILGQYHDCWWPSSLRRQIISGHDIDCVHCGYHGFPCDCISTTCDVSVSRNERICQCTVRCRYNMMTSSNGHIFRVTGPLCREFTGHLTKASDAELWCFLWYAPWINGWVNNREAGDLRRHHVHYDIIVMTQPIFSTFLTIDTPYLAR